MAQNGAKVLLGFEDELITEKNKSYVNFTTNKIGGKPDLPNNIKLDPPICPLCQLARPLVLQIYAPLDNLSFHRILYLFACINPNCWNHPDSWICLRIQSQENIIEQSEDTSSSTVSTTKTSDITKWCADADDWDDDDNNANCNEENGNLINNVERVSDEDDESCSFEDSIRAGLGNLTVDDQNANNGALGGAVGRLHSPLATAEIEGDEGEVISIDSPTMPQHDIVALFQEATPLPQDLCRSSIVQFIPSFISVWEETHTSSAIPDRHVKELLQEYQQRTADDPHLVSPERGAAARLNDNAVYEKYEKSNPAHGDKMFHHFLSKVQMNPGQVLRYSRCEDPLLLRPLQETPQRCVHCQAEMVFEFQVLPTIIPKLRLATDKRRATRLEFGTVLVYTCEKSCWGGEGDFRQEVVVVQAEVY